MIDVVADREVVLLNRVVGDWYVFAEWVVRGRAEPGRLSGFAGGEAVEMRFASVFPLTEDWRLGGEQGYCVVRQADAMTPEPTGTSTEFVDADTHVYVDADTHCMRT